MAKLTEEEKARRALNRRRKAALEAEEDAIRQEKKQREWETNGVRLTWAEFEAGVSCRGCELPIRDDTEGWPLPINMDDHQRKEYEAAEADFRNRHADCRSHRWRMQGSKTTHCGFCCPPLPPSEEQIKRVAGFLAALRRRPTNSEDLDTWRLTLTCDHVAEKSQHRSHSYWSGYVVHCEDCQQIRGIVTTEKLPPTVVRRDAEQRRMTDELTKARSEHERLQKKAASVRRRMTKLENELETLSET